MPTEGKYLSKIGSAMLFFFFFFFLPRSLLRVAYHMPSKEEPALKLVEWASVTRKNVYEVLLRNAAWIPSISNDPELLEV